MHRKAMWNKNSNFIVLGIGEILSIKVQSIRFIKIKDKIVRKVFRIILGKGVILFILNESIHN